jgi:hypothetical protein
MSQTAPASSSPGLQQATLATVSSTADPGPRVNGTVRAIAQVGDLTIIGGSFTTVNGFPRQNIAALTADGKVDRTFNPGADGIVYALAGSSDGATIFVGGLFTTVGGVARANLAAVDATGAVLPGWQADTTSSTTAEVFTLAVSGSRLYVGGKFGRIDGLARGRLVALDTTTGDVVTTFRPAPNWTVKAVALSPDGTKLYAVGGFETIGGQSRALGVAELLTSSGAATAFTPSAGGGAPIAVAVTPDGSRMFFSTENNTLFAYDPAVSNSPTYSVKTGGDTQAIAASASAVYIGGHFGQILTPVKVKRQWIASLDLTNGTVNAWDPGLSGGSMGVWAIALTENRMHVGGEFTSVAGLSRRGYVAFSGTP